jgi:carboxypeptidase Taq
MYKDYLDVEVPSDALGVLQDTHWSGGLFGYFPSYALGSAYGAQFAHVMGQELDLDTLAREGNLAAITEWLKEKIHRHGTLYKPADLISRVCGEPFNPKYYIRYLNRKMKDVYSL